LYAFAGQKCGEENPPLYPSKSHTGKAHGIKHNSCYQHTKLLFCEEAGRRDSLLLFNITKIIFVKEFLISFTQTKNRSIR